MRILYLTRSDSVHDQRFLSALAESGHEGCVLRLYPGNYPTPTGVKALTWAGFEQGLQNWNLPVAQRALERLIDQVQPDLIHAGPLPDLAFLAAKTGFRNLLAMSWGFDLMKDVRVSKLDEHRTRFALRNARGLITDARCSAEAAVSFGFPEDKITIFPWGVDLENFSPDRAQKLGKPWREKMGWQDKTVLLCLRSWEPNYGVDVLIESFGRAAAKNPDLRLILLGDGSLREEYLRLLATQEIKDKVYIGGRVPNLELITFYGAADVYVTPSHVDGSSVSLMEALACGLPAAASDIPANLEWVKAGENGWIFRDNSVEDLTEILLALPKAISEEMPRKAKKTALQKADWSVNKKKLLACWQALAPKEGCQNEK